MSFQHRFVQGLGVKERMHPPYLLGRVLLAITLLVLGTQADRQLSKLAVTGGYRQGT